MNNVTNWQPASDQLVISPGNLHVWRFNFSDCNQIKQLSILSTDERVRAKRLLVPTKQQQFINTRMQLRLLLSRYLTIPPEQINFKYNNYGKPSLKQQHNQPITFNLSHSGSLGVIAIGYDCAVGIDIEEIDAKLNYLQLANRYFSEAEINQLQERTGSEQRDEFYRLWTQKEAIMKMVGTGFSNTKAKEIGDSPISNACTTNFTVAAKYKATAAAAEKLIINYHDLNFGDY